MCLALGPQHGDAVRLEPTASRSRAKHSTTEPLRSQQAICSPHNYSKIKVRGQGHSDPKWYVTPRHHQDAFTHQIWYFYLKEYWRYAPDSMPILETRSKVKVIVTQGWYASICHPKMHAHTKFVIPTSNNIRYAPDTKHFRRTDRPTDRGTV